MKLRTLDEFQPLLDLKQPNVVCLPEEEFFAQLEEISDTTTPTTLISHCMDQVHGFLYHDKIKLLNQLAKERQHLTFIIISVNQLDLCQEVVYYYFPEYHAIYWPLYASKTPSNLKITHHFLSLNKRGDPWRQILYKKFHNDNLLEKSHFSYLCEDNNYGSLYHEPTWYNNKHWADEYFIPKHMPELAGVWPNKKFIKLEDDPLLDAYKDNSQYYIDPSWVDPTWSVDLSLVNTSFCNVIIETDIGNKLVNISEKTIGALASGHPMLLIGSKGTHQYLKDLGFDMFDDIFDNSFDQEWGLYQRFCLFTKSLDKIADKTIEELEQIQNNIWDRCLKNRQRVKELHEIMHTRAREIVQLVFHKLNM